MKKALCALVLILAFPSLALAAPFCVATQYGENCYYYSRSDCERVAAQRKGACILNQAELQERDNPSGGGQSHPTQPPSGPPFCVVTRYATNCYYWNADSCQSAAARADGQCVYRR